MTQPRPRPVRPAAARGFTLIELLLVLLLLAVASGMVSLALSDGTAQRLEQESARLAALLESARAEARASGLQVHWQPAQGTADADFRFHGLPKTLGLPNRWLDANVNAEVVGNGSVRLGPEPLIGPQRIVLRLGAERLAIVTDGLGPFSVQAVGTP